MNYTPKSLKKIFKKTINDISLHPEIYEKNPSKDFSRNRKLPFNQMLKRILSMSGKSLGRELMDYFDMDVSALTVSAFVQQRSKINYEAFETLFHTFTDAIIDEQHIFKGYR